MKSQLAVLYLATVVLSPWVAWSSPLATRNGHGLDFLMPGVQPLVVDTYLCHGMKMGKDPLFVTGFKPLASMEKVHHILIYGCTEPGSNKKVWDCGEMHADSAAFETAPVCASGSKIIYAWAMDAPELHLPKDVAFKVGGNTEIQWLVLQVHYKDVSLFIPPNNQTDSSGVTMITTDQPQPKLAGVYLLGTGGEIPGHSTTYMETACSYNEAPVLHPFAFRTHAHSHGRVVSGYRVRDGQWTEIGRMSPQKPQMFYNVTNPGVTVKHGDILAARCTMVNDEDRTIKVGSTGNDEMCNFYIMYYVDGERMPGDEYCFTMGPPSWNWKDFDGLDVALVPLSASIIPGTSQVITASRLMDKLDNLEKSMDRQHDRMKNFLRNMVETLDEAQPANYARDDVISNSVEEEPSYADVMDRSERGYNYFDEE